MGDWPRRPKSFRRSGDRFTATCRAQLLWPKGAPNASGSSTGPIGSAHIAGPHRRRTELATATAAPHARERVLFPGLHPTAFEHPLDRTALEALRKTPGLDLLLK